MDATMREMLDLLLRWVHLVAGIMWIGNSMLYNWLDRNLIQADPPKEGDEGHLWMAHSGAFYIVRKLQLQPSEMPPVLHWFKWQAYTTWISGFFLLGVVYYMGGGALLVDPTVSNISVANATLLGLGLLVVAWAVYDTLWKSPLGNQPKIAGVVSFALVMGVAYALTHILGGRAAYLHVGAMLGTLMAGNVFMRIMPAQRRLVEATMAGQKQDKAIAMRAKQRSIHNNYMTFPVLFIMLSNHFPSFYGHSLNWLILGVLMLGGAGVRHFMNIRFNYGQWLPALLATVVVAVGTAYYLVTRPPADSAQPVVGASAAPVAFSEVQGVLQQRCATCHSASATDTTFGKAPGGVAFDSPEQITKLSERIHARAVTSKTMPPGNKTGMTDAERAMLGAWVTQGAHGP